MLSSKAATGNRPLPTVFVFKGLSETAPTAMGTAPTPCTAGPREAGDRHSVRSARAARPHPGHTASGHRLCPLGGPHSHGSHTARHGLSKACDKHGLLWRRERTERGEGQSHDIWENAGLPENGKRRRERRSEVQLALTNGKRAGGRGNSSCSFSESPVPSDTSRRMALPHLLACALSPGSSAER